MLSVTRQMGRQTSGREVTALGGTCEESATNNEWTVGMDGWIDGFVGS